MIAGEHEIEAVMPRRLTPPPARRPQRGAERPSAAPEDREPPDHVQPADCWTIRSASDARRLPSRRSMSRTCSRPSGSACRSASTMRAPDTTITWYPRSSCARGRAERRVRRPHQIYLRLGADEHDGRGDERDRSARARRPRPRKKREQARAEQDGASRPLDRDQCVGQPRAVNAAAWPTGVAADVGASRTACRARAPSGRGPSEDPGRRTA